MEELSYSFHLSNDKNKTIKAKQEALNSPSGLSDIGWQKVVHDGGKR